MIAMESDEECGNPYKYCNCDKKMNIFRVFTFASLLITVVVLLFTSMPYWFGKTEPFVFEGIYEVCRESLYGA